VTQTPAVVSNVGPGGLVTQTPAVVTNTAGMGISGVGYGVQTQVIPSIAPPSTSRVEYVPVQQTVVDYETREWVETVPRQQTITEYQERRWTETVPREVVRVDQYAIEYLREYVPEVVATSNVQVIPQERLIQRTEYYPVERQVNLGLQGMKQVGGVVNVGAAMNHTVTSMGVTVGETFVTPGPPMPAQVVNYVPGVATGVGVATGGYGGIGVSGVGVGGYGYGVGGPAVATSTVVGGYGGAGYGAGYGTGIGAGYGAGYGVQGVGVQGVGYSGYGAGYGGAGYGGAGYGGAMSQTPGVVTNVDISGNITQTPVMVTNQV